MKSRRVKSAVKGILKSSKPRLYNNVRSLHQFFNISVYHFLSQYKFPDTVFPVEEAVTRNLINDLMPLKGNIQYFNRINPEPLTGGDLLLILRGDYQGKRKELKILYQAKITDWRKGVPHIVLDNKLFSRITTDNLRTLMKYHPHFNFYWDEEWVWNSEHFQHEALYNFSKIIKAEPIYLMYRYRHSEKVERDQAISLVFCRRLLEIFISSLRQKFSYPESLLGNAVFFPESEEGIKKIASGNGGFIFFGSNLEESYNTYLSLFNKYVSSLDGAVEMKPLELENVGETNYKLNKIQGETFKDKEHVGIYKAGDELYSLHLENTNSEFPVIAPSELIIWDIDSDSR